MDSSAGNQNSPVPAYIQELMNMIQASQERMQTLEENNKQMMETISKLASSPITPQVQPVNGSGNTSDEATLLNTNTSNGDNTPINLLPSGNTINPSTTFAGTSTIIAGTSTVTALETTSQGYVTKEELQKLLEQKNKSMSFSEFDLKLPYPTRVAAKSYPKDYTSPKFKQFNGKTGDAREHVMKFVETLGVGGFDDDLKLKEFSKSLTEKAYTWYVNLTPGSVESWSQMCRMFGEKFFSTQEKVTLIDLGREYQMPKEDVMDYIQRFREKVLDIQEAHDEKELVKVCIQGMFHEFQLYLQNLSLHSFSTLVEAARRTNNTIMRNKKQINHFHQREDAFFASHKEKSYKKSKLSHGEQVSPPPFPCSMEKVLELLNKWVNEGSIRLPNVEHQPTNKEKTGPMYCHFHRSIGHPTKECNSLRKIYHAKVKNN